MVQTPGYVPKNSLFLGGPTEKTDKNPLRLIDLKLLQSLTHVHDIQPVISLKFVITNNLWWDRSVNVIKACLH